MPNFISDLHDRSEALSGKKLAVVLIAVLVIFLFLGIFVGYFIPKILKNNEDIPPVDISEVKKEENEQYEGKVVFIDPNFYPNDNISYYLADPSGKEIILLTARDEKLAVVEGLNVILFGKTEKTKDGKEQVLIVEKAVVVNR